MNILDSSSSCIDLIFTSQSNFAKCQTFKSTAQNHLGLILDNRLSFEEYLTAMRVKVKALHKQNHTTLSQNFNSFYRDTL